MFEYRQAQEVRDAFERSGVRYLLDDIIASKQASGRRKDLESLPRLRAFRDWWKGRKKL